MRPGLSENKGHWEFEALKKMIFKETGIDCSKYKDNYLKRRIDVRLRVNRVKTYAEYMRLLVTNPDEYRSLIDDIAINVTKFFRDPETFDVLENVILPSLIYGKAMGKKRAIRVWSAGCASGEEPYSIAILLRELLGEEFGDYLVSIHATDVDTESLAQARKGLYNGPQLENVPEAYLKRYFERQGDCYQISKEIMRMVKLSRLDLFSEVRPSHFDMILCRNVVIYFSKEMQYQLYRQFYDALNSDGYLVLGKTESLIGGSKDLFALIDPKERIYQKKATR